MRQYDVYPNPSPASREFAPYIVVLQSHLLSALETLIVAPLLIDAEPHLSDFDVPVVFEGREFWIALAELGNVEKRRLSRPVGNLVAYHDQIGRGISRIFNGF